MPSGSERTMAYMAWLSSRAGTPGAVGLYVGAHDPWSRLKFMPAACLPLGATSFTNAGLRAVHLPTSFNDASTAAFEIPYPVVVAAFKGGWWDAAQMYRTWALQGAHWTRKGKLSAQRIPRWLSRPRSGCASLASTPRPTLPLHWWMACAMCSAVCRTSACIGTHGT